MKAQALKVTYSDGTVYTWSFWRDGRWYLKTHDGYVRTLESNWLNSVPRIQAIATNYGMTVRVS